MLGCILVELADAFAEAQLIRPPVLSPVEAQARCGKTACSGAAGQQAMMPVDTYNEAVPIRSSSSVGLLADSSPCTQPQHKHLLMTI